MCINRRDRIKTSLVIADYLNQNHAEDILFLLDKYSCDSMGGGKKLPEVVMNNLIPKLSKMDGATSIICYVDSAPAGLANCFDAFSTFKCKPVLNIHDLVVLEGFRGLGLSQQLLNKIEEIAIDKGCCKITLEVLEGNEIAKKSYKKFGFAGYELDPKTGKALFWEKEIFSQ